MPHQDGGNDPQRLQQPEGRHLEREECGLRHRRFVEQARQVRAGVGRHHVVDRVRQQRIELGADRVPRLREYRERSHQFMTHADPLAALAGEQDADVRHHPPHCRRSRPMPGHPLTTRPDRTGTPTARNPAPPRDGRTPSDPRRGTTPHRPRVVPDRRRRRPQPLRLTCQRLRASRRHQPRHDAGWLLGTGRALGLVGITCSRITCALVPLIPNDEIPARRGRSACGHAAARSRGPPHRRPVDLMCRLVDMQRRAAGRPCRIAMTILITPATPAAAWVCPMFDFNDPRCSGRGAVLPVRRQQRLGLDRIT